MTLLELLDLMRKKLALVIALPIAFAIITAVYCWGFMPDEYTASTSMYILSNNAASETGSSSSSLSSDLSASQMLANDFATIAKSDRVKQGAAEALKMSSLAGYKVEVTSATTTRVITISVTGQSPDAVAIIANQMTSEISDVATEVMDLKSVNVIDVAKAPQNPSGPNRLLYTLVALLAGLFVAIAIVVLLDLVNTTFKTPEEAEELLGVPVIGRIPNIAKRRR